MVFSCISSTLFLAFSNLFVCLFIHSFILFLIVVTVVNVRERRIVFLIYQNEANFLLSAFFYCALNVSLIFYLRLSRCLFFVCLK